MLLAFPVLSGLQNTSPYVIEMRIGEGGPNRGSSSWWQCCSSIVTVQSVIVATLGQEVWYWQAVPWQDHPLPRAKMPNYPPPSLIMYKLRRRQGRESKAHTSSRLSPPSLAASSDGLTEVLICCHYSCQHYSRKTCGFPLSTIHPAPHPLSRPCWQDHLVNIKGKKLTKKTHATTTSKDW